MTISAYGFSTYEEFLKLLKALPEEYRKTWIENIPKKRLFMESSTGTGSVAGFLIPDMYTPENIYDDALLYTKNNVGTTIARTLAECGRSGKATYSPCTGVMRR